MCKEVVEHRRLEVSFGNESAVKAETKRRNHTTITTLQDPICPVTLPDSYVSSNQVSVLSTADTITS